MQLKPLTALALLLIAMTSTLNAEIADMRSHYLPIKSFGDFIEEKSTNAGEKILISPMIKAPNHWDELVVSWNATTPGASWVKVEAKVIYPEKQTKFYALGNWSDNPDKHPRESVGRQRDEDGRVNTDVLMMKKSGGDIRLRVTLAGEAKLKYMGVSFVDSKADITPLESDHKAWGKIISTPERSQHSYPQEQGWCSPTSLSMVLARWGDVLHRPELNMDVPEVAAGVYDEGFGTGNWPFNAAFAGKFPGMKAYITRLNDVVELEDWISAGIPVIISAPWHMLQPGRGDTGAGHLTVCIGFTAEGDFVINDPATNLKKGQKVQHIYKRADVVKAWKKSENTVYLVYPEDAKVPVDRFGHWDGGK